MSPVQGFAAEHGSGDVVEDPSRLDDGALVEVLKDGWGYRNGLEAIPQQTYGKAMNQALHASY